MKRGKRVNIFSNSKSVFIFLPGVSALDYYMVEIFGLSNMKFNPGIAAIIVRAVEIVSKCLSTRR